MLIRHLEVNLANRRFSLKGRLPHSEKCVLDG